MTMVFGRFLTPFTLRGNPQPNRVLTTRLRRTSTRTHRLIITSLVLLPPTSKRRRRPLLRLTRHRSRTIIGVRHVQRLFMMLTFRQFRNVRIRPTTRVNSFSTNRWTGRPIRTMITPNTRHTMTTNLTTLRGTKTGTTIMFFMNTIIRGQRRIHGDTLIVTIRRSRVLMPINHHMTRHSLITTTRAMILIVTRRTSQHIKMTNRPILRNNLNTINETIICSSTLPRPQNGTLVRRLQGRPHSLLFTIVDESGGRRFFRKGLLFYARFCVVGVVRRHTTGHGGGDPLLKGRRTVFTNRSDASLHKQVQDPPLRL